MLTARFLTPSSSDETARITTPDGAPTPIWSKPLADDTETTLRFAFSARQGGDRGSWTVDVSAFAGAGVLTIEQVRFVTIDLSDGAKAAGWAPSFDAQGLTLRALVAGQAAWGVTVSQITSST